MRITPPVGVDLSGYGDREGPSIKVHDDLWCRAVMLRDGAAYLAVVSLDVLGLDFPLDAAIRQQVSRERTEPGAPAAELQPHPCRARGGLSVPGPAALGKPRTGAGAGRAG